MKTVLITGVGSNIGQGIIKAVRMSSLPARIIGTDIQPFSAGLFRCEKGYVVPSASDESCLERFIDICKTESVDIIFIGSDAEADFFSSRKAALESATGTKVLVSNRSVVRTGHDKFETFNFLNKNALPSPQTLLYSGQTTDEILNDLHFPLIVKPRSGAGSRNVFKVNDEQELACALRMVPDALLQRFLEGDEYTSGLFFDSDSSLKGVICMKRDLSSGTTYRAVVSDFPEVRDEVLKVAAPLSSMKAIGPINVQSIHSGDTLSTIEINPRFSGTTSFRAHFGFNEPEAALRHFLLGEDIKEMSHSHGIVMRYWEELYGSIEDMESIMKNGSTEGSRTVIQRDF